MFPPIGVLWPVLVKLAPKLWELLVEGHDPDTITFGQLLDENTKNKMRRDAALARAKKRVAGDDTPWPPGASSQ